MRMYFTQRPTNIQYHVGVDYAHAPEKVLALMLLLPAPFEVILPPTSGSLPPCGFIIRCK